MATLLLLIAVVAAPVPPAPTAYGYHAGHVVSHWPAPAVYVAPSYVARPGEFAGLAGGTSIVLNSPLAPAPRPAPAPAPPRRVMPQKPTTAATNAVDGHYVAPVVVENPHVARNEWSMLDEFGQPRDAMAMARRAQEQFRRRDAAELAKAKP